MRKFLIAVLMNLLFVSSAFAAVETYEGTDEYYVLGAVENINVARERAKERALRDAREKAGVYIHAISRAVNMNMIEDEIISIASGVLRVLDTVYEIVQLPDMDGYLIRATVRADIDTNNVEKFLQKDAEELSKIVAGERALRQQEEQQDQRIDALKQEYRQAGTQEEKDLIAQRIVEEDKIFLANVKLREGNKFRDEKNYKQAEKLFTEAIELNPNNSLAYHNRGWAYIDQKKYQQALDDFNKSSALNPNSELPYFGRGFVYIETKKYQEAIEDFNIVIKMNPKYAAAWNNRGAAKSWLNQMREAVADYNKAIELNPNYYKAYENRGKAFSALGERGKATADFKRAEKIYISIKGGDKLIEEALELGKRGEGIAALNLLNQAAERYPDNQFIFINRGNIYKDNLGDYDAAIADYNKAIEINPKFPPWPYHNRAIVLGRLKRWDDAIADYNYAIELDQNYASAYNGRAWSYCQIGKFAEALPDANKAVELTPNEANFLDTRAFAYMGLKRYEEALADLNNALKLSQEGWIYNRRGELYQLMGDEAKAKADFAKAKKLGN